MHYFFVTHSFTTARGCFVPTFKLPLCVDDAQVGWYGVKAAAADHIHALGRGFGVVLQLHSLQELKNTATRREVKQRLVLVCGEEVNESRVVCFPTCGSPQMSR